MKLGIIGAMEVEVAALKEQMKNKEDKIIAGSCYCEGKIQNLPVVICQCGVGKVNAAMCVQTMCDVFRVTHLVNTGVAGSLSNTLDIGDLVISTDAVHHDFDCSPMGYEHSQIPGLSVKNFPADKELISMALCAAEALNPGHVQQGRIASGDQFVAQNSAKQQIIENTGALCTEMEGAAIAQAAWRNQIPFVIIRAISDKADDSVHMDYSVFEPIAAQRCAQVTGYMASQLSELNQ